MRLTDWLLVGLGVEALLIGFVICCFLTVIHFDLRELIEEKEDEDDLDEKPALVFDSDQIARGAHCCPEWDELMIYPGSPEWEACTCQVKKDLERGV